MKSLQRKIFDLGTYIAIVAAALPGIQKGCRNPLVDEPHLQPDSGVEEDYGFPLIDRPHTQPGELHENWASGLEDVIDDSTAVLLVDMQEPFIKLTDPFELETEIPYQIAVIRYCAENDIPLIVFESYKHGKTPAGLRTEIDKVPRHKYITKSRDDGFRNPETIETLERWGTDTVYMMGLYASVCVRETAFSASYFHGLSILASPRTMADDMGRKHLNESVSFYLEYGNLIQ